MITEPCVKAYFTVLEYILNTEGSANDIRLFFIPVSNFGNTHYHSVNSLHKQKITKETRNKQPEKPLLRAADSANVTLNKGCHFIWSVYLQLEHSVDSGKYIFSCYFTLPHSGHICNVFNPY